MTKLGRNTRKKKSIQNNNEIKKNRDQIQYENKLKSNVYG